MRRRDAVGRPYESVSLDRRRGVLGAFKEARKSGEVRDIGLSTHSTSVLREAPEVPEIEVVSTTLNVAGGYVEDGSLEEHVGAIRGLHEAGRGRLRGKAPVRRGL